jgi:glyoxylase-like metal-dependent hydrolase (beta-lactamase superfamily II)
VVLTGPAADRPAIATHLFTGDTLFPGGPGRTQDADAFDRIMRSLRDRLFTLPDDTWVYPGHGDDTTIGAERPHLDDWQQRRW